LGERILIYQLEPYDPWNYFEELELTIN
jgi:hypothetical protein